MNDATRRALSLCLPSLYESLAACVDVGMEVTNGKPKPGSMEADCKPWLSETLEAIHAVEGVIGRHLHPLTPNWVADIIDGRIVP